MLLFKCCIKTVIEVLQISLVIRRVTKWLLKSLWRDFIAMPSFLFMMEYVVNRLFDFRSLYFLWWFLINAFKHSKNLYHWCFNTAEQLPDVQDVECFLIYIGVLLAPLRTHIINSLPFHHRYLQSVTLSQMNY